MKRFYKFLMPLVAVVAMALPWNVQAQVTCDSGNPVTVSNADTGTTTSSYFPGYSLYNYSFSEVLILADDLTGIGDIKALQFKPASTTAGSYFTNCEIYLANTELTDLSAGFLNDASAFELVWSGNLSYTTTDWQTIVFDDAFTWDGSSNIIVAVRRNHGSWTSGSSFVAFNAGATMGRYVSQDSGPYTIGSLPSGTGTSTVAWYKLLGCEGSGDVCYRVRNVAASAITSDGFTLTWSDTLNNGATYTVMNMADSTVLGVTSDTSYIITGLNSNTLYSIGVMADCGSGTLSSYARTSVRTACGGYTSVPYADGFEGASTGDLPNCWMAVQTGTSGSGTFPSIYNYSSNTRTGNGYFEFESSTGNDVEVVALPAMQNISSLKLTMWISSSSNYPCNFEVGVMEDTVFVPVDTLNIITFSGTSSWSSNYNEYTVYFANYTGSGERIAMRATAAGSGQYTLFVDDLTVDEFSGCYPVSDVTVSDVQSSSAIVSWTDNLNSSAAYRIYWSDGTNADSVDVTNVNTYTLLNLTASTDYTVTVVVVCGDAGLTTPATTTFRTDCDGGGCDIIVSMTDTFGDGWNGNAIVGTHNGQTIFSATLEGGSSGTFTYHTCAADTVILTWDEGSYSGEADFIVTVGGSPVVSGNGANFSDGDVMDTITGCPACIAPSAFTLDSVGINEAAFHWSGTASSYRLYWSDGTTTDSIDVTDLFYTLTTLTPSTSYTVSVAAICDEGISSAVGTSFSTLCAAGGCEVVISMTDSYGDGWNGNAINGIVSGQSVFAATISDGSNGTYSYSQCATDTLVLTWTTGSYSSEASFVVTVGGALIVNGNGSDYSDGTTVATLTGCPACPSPSNIAVDSVTSDEITIHWTAGDQETAWNVTVNDSLISNITTNPYTITGLEQYTEYTITVSADCGDGDNSYPSLPITVRTLVACPWPTNFAVTIADDTASFSWTDTLGSNWDLVYGPTGFDPNSENVENLSSTSYEVDGLTTGFYEAYVRTNCGVSNSLWTGPVSFTVGYTIVNMGTSGSDTLNTCAAIIYDNGGPTGNYSSSADYTLVVYPSQTDSIVSFQGTFIHESCCDHLYIYEGVGTDGTLLWSDGSASTSQTIPVDTSLVGPITVVFHSDGSVVYEGFELFVNCVAAPSCMRPYSVTAPSVMSDQITINVNGTATAYKAYITDGTTVDSVSFTGTTYTFTGLTSLTTYTISVASDCGTETSDLVTITVTTNMVAATLPYSTGFEAGQDVAWFLENGTQTNQWVIDSATNNGGSYALYISNDNGASNSYSTSSTSNVFAYKVLAFDSVGDYGVSFDWKANGESCCDYLRVFLAPDSAEFTAGSMGSISSTGAPAGWIALDGGSKLNSSSNWQNRFEIITIPVATNYSLVFFWHNDGSVGTNPPAAIDNVQVGRLSCSTPTALTVSNVTGTSADIAWTPGGDESQWEVSLNGVSTIVSSPAYNAMGLSNSTNYNVTVRSICGAGDTSFAASTSFTTEICDIFTEALNYDTAATATTSSYSPIGYSLYNYSYIQTIITADRMASIGGDITAMAFNAASTTSGDYFTNMSVYMANVSEDNLAAGPILPDSAHTFVQVVNNSDFTFTTTGWQPHAFDTSFHWDGSSNVLVAVKRDNGSWGSTASFVAHEDTVERMYYAYQDSGPVDITTAMASYTSSSTTVGDIKLISCGTGCAIPTIVSTTSDDNSVTFNWTGSASNYEVAAVAGNWVEPTSGTPVVGNTTTVSGLTSGTLYYVGVRAVCDEGVYSNWYVDTVSTTEHPCLAPTNVTASNVTLNGATLSWTPAEAGQTHFEVRVSANADTTYVDANGTTADITGLYHNTEYSVAVRAVCGENNYSDWSAPITFRTATCQPVQNVTVSNITVTTATVNWTANGSSNYELAWGYPGTPRDNCEHQTVNTNSYTISGLEEHTSYVVYVRSVCAEGVYSDWTDGTPFMTERETGIEDVDNARISLYPNPASSTVTLTGIEGAAKVTVVDMNGREVYTQSLSHSATQSLTIDVSQLTQGAYFVRITGERVNAIRKLIVR